MATSPLAAQVAATIRLYNLTKPGERVLVAVSGGPDSMAILHALAELRGELGLSLLVAHFNHRLRGAASDEDAQFVAGQAAALGLPCHIGAADVAAQWRERGLSLEMAARRARYAFFQSAAAITGAHRVALGHTADDQAETILLRLLRGGELDALRGMPIARPLAQGHPTTVIRPLLELSRSQVLEYLASQRIPWRADASNLDTTITRNWIRHELLPALNARCGDARGLLLRAGAAGARLADLIAASAEPLAAVRGRDEVRLEVAALADAPRLLRRAVLRQACRPCEVSWRTLDELERLLHPPSGRTVCLPNGLQAQHCYGQIIIRRARAAASELTLSLSIPGRLDIPQVGLRLEASETTRDHAIGGDRWQEVVDLDVTGESLRVRTRRPGDRFVPLGLGAPTKLKDFLIRLRIPRAERDRLLLVEGKCGIVWVVGVRLDDRAKVTSSTRRRAILRATPLP